ncbi:MAG: type I glutamate--ammonia ligase [Chloroflexota bacterium]|nr:type I glutamate--ammonia ligase [Chloroflexota bacterium]
MFEEFDQARDYVRKHGIRMIDLKFCDLWGRWRHLTLSANEFTAEFMAQGVGFDGSSVGLKNVKAGDMVLVPDLATGFMDPFWEEPTLSFICSTREADTKAIFARDARNMAVRAEEVLRESGVADESLWGPEFEFYVFDSVSYENGVNCAAYRVDSSEANWHSADCGQGYCIKPHGGYHAIPPNDRLYNLRSQMVLYLEEMGVKVKYHHHEVGGPGQSEIEIPLTGLVRSGDVTMFAKYVARMTSYARGQTVTFMPKPLYGEAGNGMHFHQTLFKDGRNLFYDAAGYGGLSQTAFYYIGGLLRHGPALLALTNPSTNSYRRLIPGFEAPVNLFFSLGNRSAAIRIPKYATAPGSKRIEFRPPDATCNVYLALAAQLLAGLDGILNEIDPTAEGFGPIDANIFTWSEERRSAIKGVPASLDEALCALEADYEFLLRGGVFDEGLLADWAEHKRYNEEYAVRHRPHPYEVELYFDA